jgi:hypothetical protein
MSHQFTLDNNENDKAFRTTMQNFRQIAVVLTNSATGFVTSPICHFLVVLSPDIGQGRSERALCKRAE